MNILNFGSLESSSVELTNALRKFDPEDPVKFDYALFGLGVFEKF